MSFCKRQRCTARLLFENLEPRRVLATYTVDSAADVVDANDGVLTLREAVEESNATLDVSDVIDFEDHLAGRTILLTLGELKVLDKLTILGPGANSLTIDASGNDPTIDIDDGAGSRVFTVEPPEGREEPAFEIVGLTLTGGDASDAGGAILCNCSEMVVRESTIRGNHTFRWGGAIYPLGPLRLENVLFENNRSGLDGGAIHSQQPVTVLSSTFSNNAAYGVGSEGGAILVARTTLSITGSTFSGNQVLEILGDGGAIYAVNMSIRIGNSTFTGNQTHFGDGGAIYSINSSFHISNSTFVFNSSPTVGGVLTSGDTIVENSIIALNSGSTLNDIVASQGAHFQFNVIGVGTGARLRPTENGIADAHGNHVGTPTDPKDPQIGPLGDNGGSVMTHALLLGSPAIGGGDPSFARPPEFDQRGDPRVSGSRIDIGAFEYQLPTIDVSDDGTIDCQDIDLIVSAIASGIGIERFDITGDGRIDHADLTEWITLAGRAHESGEPFREGDANLDGHIDGTDFGIWNGNRFTNTSKWCSGDFNADGNVDASDFNKWLQGRFEGQEPVAAAGIVTETRRLPKAALAVFLDEPQAVAPVLRGAFGFLVARDTSPENIPDFEDENKDAHVNSAAERRSRVASGGKVFTAKAPHEWQDTTLAEQLIDSLFRDWCRL